MSSTPSAGDSQPLTSCSRSLQASLRNLSAFTQPHRLEIQLYAQKGRYEDIQHESNEETHVKKSQLHLAGCLKMNCLFLRVNHWNIKAEF